MPAMHTERNYWILHTAYWIVCEILNLFNVSYFGANLKDIYVIESVILFTGTHFLGVFVGRYTFAKDWKIMAFWGISICLTLSAIVSFLHIHFFGSIVPLLPIHSKFTYLLIIYTNPLQYIYPWFGVFYIHEFVSANSKIVKKQSETNLSLQLAQLENLENQINQSSFFIQFAQQHQSTYLIQRIFGP